MRLSLNYRILKRQQMKIVSHLAVLLLLLFTYNSATSGTKEDNSPIAKLRKDIEFLCSSDCDGRFTGSKGEEIAANYIENRFKEIGLSPFKGKYKWEFTANVGLRVGEGAFFSVFDQRLTIGKDVIFMPYSGSNYLSGSCMPKVYEEDNVWLVPLSEARLTETNDFQSRLYEHAKKCVSNKASAIVYLNDLGANYDFSATDLKKFEALPVAIVVMNQQAVKNYIKPNLKKEWIEIEARLGYEKANAIGKNVTGYIDNKSAITIVIGSHYDHLGTGFPGADDNASGVAGMLQLAELSKQNRLSRYNYLFVAFSGNQQKFQGSQAFLKQHEAFTSSFGCMIDVDMIGRYNDIGKELYINGTATSGEWSSILKSSNTIYNLKMDSLGIGFSDFTNFNKANVPCIKLSTGYHKDYHKASDTPKEINYAGQLGVIQYIFNVMSALDKRTKLTYVKANDYLPRIEKIETDLGIIPDNSYENNGIRVGACLPNKTAEKAGLSSGDIISKIGEFIIVDIEDYIEALTKTDKGKETVIIVKRDKYEFKFYVIL